MDPIALVFSSAGGFFLAMALKASAVLLGAMLVNYALARASASARHAAWTIAIGALLALPVLETLSPRLLAPVPAPLMRTVLVPDRAATAAATALPPGANPTNRASFNGVLPIEAAPRAASPPLPSWPSVMAWIWVAGFAFVIGFQGLGRALLARAARRAQPLDDPEWHALLAGLRHRLGISRTIRLLVADHAAAPMTWGLRRPILLLPRAAVGWSNAKRRAILVHELGHVRRNDCLVQDLAHVACALYWFHPGVWFAAHRLRVERELACDDLVLSDGTGPSDYAEYLVDVARSVRDAGRRLALPGLGMAQCSRLESRVRAILDLTLDRRRLTGRGAVWAIAIAAAVVLPLGALELTASASTASERARSARTSNPQAARQDERPLRERWSSAFEQAPERGGFWIAWAIGFGGGLGGRETLISDSGSWNLDELDPHGRGRSLAERFGFESDDAVILLHYAGRGDRASFDRIAIRTARLTPELGRDPVVSLGAVPDDESLAELERVLANVPDDHRAQVVVTAISLHDPPRTVSVLLGLLNGRRGALVRAQAAEGLARHPGPEALDALVEHARRDRDVDVQAEAAEAIGDLRYGPATDALIALAQQADVERVRVEAVESLGEREPERVVSILEAIANRDPSEAVQHEATETLGDLPHHAGWPALRRILARHPDRGVRDEARETLDEQLHGKQRHGKDNSEDAGDEGADAR